ncbi:hypothetical protein [Hydrogenophaga sp.]|uniref:hypothetical protein n=1 Tax=Hydrogenophaga sp. TaxID=1904254 RepID=UPI002723BFA9|nr:hypothetical protein [Hydrogenophaga sp.]MDO9434477.1 hypothetical protein [Hydrogenophaga sp.]
MKIASCSGNAGQEHPVATARQKPRLLVTPDQTLSGWTSGIDRCGLSKPAVAAGFLDDVAHGRVSGGSAGRAQEVFNDLICHEAFDVFVEVFAAFNQHRLAQAMAAGTPFKSSLTLRLPLDWTPAAHQAMTDAFRQIQVEEVVVLPPEPDARKEDPRDVCVSAAACACVAALIHAGAKALVVRGVLAVPADIAAAIVSSTQLASVELGSVLVFAERPGQMVEENPALDAIGISAAEAGSYGMLATALMGCSAIRHLVLHHIDLVHVLNTSHIAQMPTWPALTSVSVSLKDSGRDARSTLGEFLQFLHAFPSLSALTLDGELSAWGDDHALVLEPLRGHPSLTRLHVEPRCNRGIDTARAVLAFSLTCPSLTHVAWKAPDLRFDYHGNLLAKTEARKKDLLPGSPDIEAMLRHPASKLKVVTLSGVAFLPEDTRSLMRGVAYNTSVQDLNLSGSLVELSATQAFEEVLVHNDTLEHLTMPRTPANYFLAVDRVIVAGFVPAGLQRTTFRLQDDGRLNPLAVTAFDKELRWHSNIVIDGFQAQLTMNRQDALRPRALPVVQTPVEPVQIFRRDPSWLAVAQTARARRLQMARSANTTTTTTTTTSNSSRAEGGPHTPNA